MLAITKIEKEEDAVRAFKKQNQAASLPQFLFHAPHFQGLVLCLLDEGQQAGLAFGVNVQADSCFYLHHFSVDSMHFRKKTVLWFLKELFDWLRKERQINEMKISVPQTEIVTPPFLSFLRQISSCSVEKVLHVRQIGLKTGDFDYFRQFHWYCPKLLERKQYEVILWKDYDPVQIRKIQEAEQLGQTEKDYLSPGIWETDWEYDEKSSFVLVKKGQNEPLGWIVSEKIGDGDTVRIRRFYIYKDKRRKMMGPAFATYALDAIAQQYEYLRFEVVQGNRQMEMFVNHYCKPILLDDYYYCNITALI